MLTDSQARKAAPRDRDYKLADANGLYLFVTRVGSKSWRMKYRFGLQEKLLTFGRYPEVSLTEARDRRDEARRLLRDGNDPAIEKKKARLAAIAQAGQTFQKLALQWHANETPRWSPVHAADVLRSLERDVFPEIGSMPIAQIDTPTVLATLRKIEARGAIETARRCRQRISDVFVYGISEGHAKGDPAAIVAGALKPLPKKGRQPAITDLVEVQKVLYAAEDAAASPITKLASRLLAITIVRPGIVLGAEWTELKNIDWEIEPGPGTNPSALWHVPSARMKLRLDKKDDPEFDFFVPLPWQAVDVLRAARRLTGRGRLVFPNHRSSARPMSENAIGYLYNRGGFFGKHCPHGWRAAFSTIMNEKAEREGRLTDGKVIDLMLAHVPKDKIEGAYNRAAYMPRRGEIAQEWADLLLDGIMAASNLLEGPRRRGNGMTALAA